LRQIISYLSELLTFEGQVDRARYGSLLHPISLVVGPLWVCAIVVGAFLSREISGWIILVAITLGILISVPLSARRARDIGWLPLFSPVLSIAAWLSIVAFLSLSFPISLGIWRMLRQTGVWPLWWGMLFAVCIGVWAWWAASLIDRPRRGQPIVEPSPPTAAQRRAPLLIIIPWTVFWGVVLSWNLILAVRYYLTGEGDKPHLMTLLIVGVIGVLLIRYWLRSRRAGPPSGPRE
jgi:hypothetical protein